MRIVCIANQKGGVGKTTCSINLSAGLAVKGKKVLLIDLDHQSHATSGLGIETDEKPTITELLLREDVEAKDVTYSTYLENLHIIPSNLMLSIADMQLSMMGAKDFRLRTKLADVKDYDYMIIDCPPSFGTVSINAFTTAKEVLIPVSLAYFCLKGVNHFIDTLSFINRSIGKVVNHHIDIAGILINHIDPQTKIARSVHTKLEEVFGDKIFKSTVPRNVKLHEAQAMGKAIYHHAATSPGAIAFHEITEEFILRG